MRFLLSFLMVCLMAVPAHAEYKANYWASWASVTTAVTWTFPYKSREVNVHNGSAVPICVAFNGATISGGCATPLGFSTNGDQRVFQLGANQLLLLQDYVTPSVTIQSSGAAASPVSVIVTY